MTQLELFDWSPPCAVMPFPYHRRQHVLRDIADTFVRDGYDAGNKRAEMFGWQMIADLWKAGVRDQHEIGREIDKFTAAWRAVAIPSLIDHEHSGGHAA